MRKVIILATDDLPLAFEQQVRLVAALLVFHAAAEEE